MDFDLKSADLGLPGPDLRLKPTAAPSPARIAQKMRYLAKRMDEAPFTKGDKLRALADQVASLSAPKPEGEWVPVRRSDLLAWAQDWQRENDPGDDTDVVTPFDGYLLSAPKPESAEAVAWAVNGPMGETAHMGSDRPDLTEPGWSARPLIYGDTAPPRPESAEAVGLIDVLNRVATHVRHDNELWQEVMGAIVQLGITAPPRPEASEGQMQALRGLIRTWREPDPDNGEEETEFDKGCEQTYRECADALEALIGAAPQQASAPAGSEKNQDREHIVEVFPKDMERLRKWLNAPNGSLSLDRVTLESVAHGGIFIRTSPYGQQPAACPKCGGTGEADSGGIMPWGAPAMIPCDCQQPSAPVGVEWLPGEIRDLASEFTDEGGATEVMLEWADRLERALAQQPAAEYADADALIAYLDSLCDESDEKWGVAQDAIAGIRAGQQPAAVDEAMDRVRRGPARLWQADLAGGQIGIDRMHEILTVALADRQQESSNG